MNKAFGTVDHDLHFLITKGPPFLVKIDHIWCKPPNQLRSWGYISKLGRV